MLYSSYYPAVKESSDKPLLVFLHGLLGSGDDWSACHPRGLSSSLHRFARAWRQSRFIDPVGFDHCCKKNRFRCYFSALWRDLPADYPIVVIGYSMGGKARHVWGDKPLLRNTQPRESHY